MVYPDFSGIELPNVDFNEDIKADYSEAASILQKSPRGSASLLRLAIQKLCKQLGESGKDINTDIGSLVKKGLPVIYAFILLVDIVTLNHPWSSLFSMAINIGLLQMSHHNPDCLKLIFITYKINYRPCLI